MSMKATPCRKCGRRPFLVRGYKVGGLFHKTWVICCRCGREINRGHITILGAIKEWNKINT